MLRDIFLDAEQSIYSPEEQYVPPLKMVTPTKMRKAKPIIVPTGIKNPLMFLEIYVIEQPDHCP